MRTGLIFILGIGLIAFARTAHAQTEYDMLLSGNLTGCNGSSCDGGYGTVGFVGVGGLQKDTSCVIGLTAEGPVEGPIGTIIYATVLKIFGDPSCNPVNGVYPPGCQTPPTCPDANLLHQYEIKIASISYNGIIQNEPSWEALTSTFNGDVIFSELPGQLVWSAANGIGYSDLVGSNLN